MNWLTLAFDRPVWLLLLLALPVVWWMSRQSLAAMGPFRQTVAVVLRSAVLIVLVLALAEVQLVRVTERVAAYFLLDQSLSVPQEQREAGMRYAAAAAERHQDTAIGDAAGVIVFGSTAQVERPLAGEPLVSSGVESHVDGERTNLAEALRLAKASLPAEVARRVVILSDGNENLGDALLEARRLADAGIGIDVAPLGVAQRSDVRVQKITLPSVTRAEMPYDVAIVLENVSPPHETSPKPVTGRLIVTRKSGTHDDLVADQPISVPPGKSVYTFREQQEVSAFYSYEARFVADDPSADRITQNNRATGFTNLEGSGSVLFIVDAESPNEFDSFIDLLGKNDLQVTKQTTDALFTSLAELQQYDAIVLANVPRVSGRDVDALAQFSDEQVRMLTQSVEHFGTGLVMLGGPSSFGAGGWANTELERAMPVDFTIKNAKVAAVGALMLVIDKSGSMDGEKLRMSKAAAQAAVDMLGPLDQVGVIAFDSGAEDVVRLQRVGDRPHQLKARIGRLMSGGGTDMEPGIRRGYAALERSNASVKHMIVLTDGQTQGSGYAQLAAAMKSKGITTTSVAVGTDAANSLLQDIAARGGGKFYRVTNPKVLPRIFTRETRRVVRPLVFEDEKGFSPQIVSDHEVLQGIDGSLPPITGFVLTTLKENPLVQAPILAPKPAAPNNAILAMWDYGLGHTAVFTTDPGQRWGSSLPEWENYEKLFVQLMRWSLRPTGDQGSFNIATDVKDGQLRTVVTAVNKQGEFLNSLPMRGVVAADGGGDSQTIEFKQVAPGRYVAETPLADSGSYLVGIHPGPGHGLLRTGVSVPYSPEFNDVAANENLLIQMASIVPPGGKPGEIIRLPEDTSRWREFQGPNVFRRDLPQGRALTGLWPIAVLVAACLFFVDVLNRRVGMALPPWRAMAARAIERLGLKRSRDTASTEPPMSRLRAAKRSAGEAIAVRRFVEEAPAERLETLVGDAERPAPPTAETASTPQPPPPTREADPLSQQSYSERLLEVKRGLRRK